jgi:hypothetical protein
VVQLCASADEGALGRLHPHGRHPQVDLQGFWILVHDQLDTLLHSAGMGSRGGSEGGGA